MTEQDDFRFLKPNLDMKNRQCPACGDELIPVDRVTHRAIVDTLKEELSRLQAVAALDENFGYWGPYRACRSCSVSKGSPHADGCPVGRYEAVK